MAETKLSLWDRLPKEIKVGVYVVGSAALAELAKYLELIEIDNLVLAGIINIIIVLIQTRVPQVRDRLRK